MSGKSALILGATGQTGKYLLAELLASSHYTRVGEFGRKTTPLETITTGRDKLEQKVIDFENLGASGLKEGSWDVVFVALGTTRKTAGSAEAFEKIDRQYVVNAAQEAKSSDPNHKQCLIYVSSGGANANSPFLYPRSKGQTELDLANLKYDDTIVFRPGFLAGTQRPESRLMESVFGHLTHALSFFTDQTEITVANLGKALCHAGEIGSQGLDTFKASKGGESGKEFTLVSNAVALALAKERN